MMKSRKIGIWIMAIMVMMPFYSCSNAQNNKNKNNTASSETKRQFTLPTIPDILTNPKDRGEYLAVHYWDNFDFADTSLINKPEVTEQIFVDFIDILPHVDYAKASEGISKMMGKAMDADTLMFAHFSDLTEKYLYDPNSPMRNENFYIPVLEYIIKSDKIGDVDKIRPEYLLEMAHKNRVGTQALDFAYTLANGKEGRLSGINSEYTMIFFNNPGCKECKRVKEYITKSPVFSSMKNLTVLAIYPDEDLTEWKNETYPTGWINGYDAKTMIKNDQLYDLKAIPTMYLLDKNKKVILKDPPIEVIEEWLAGNASANR